MARYGFVVHHNGPPAQCIGKPHSRCVSYWASVRDWHVNHNGWSDIAYSFGVCPHGIRFEGRGWDRPQFANGADVVGSNDGSDSNWYTVLAFLGWSEVNGKPVDEEPTPEMIEGVRAVIEEGRSTGRCDDRVLPHNAFKVKRCPGAAFTALSAAWDRSPLRPIPVPPPLPEDDDMQPYFIEIVDDGDASKQDGFVLPDGRVFDKLTDEEVGAFRAVYVAKIANQRQVDVVQHRVNAA